MIVVNVRVETDAANLGAMQAGMATMEGRGLRALLT